MIHAELMNTVKNGISTFRLLCKDEVLSDFFDEWVFRLAKKQPYNTVKTYAYAVLKFINYIIEVAEQHNGLTPFLMNEALDSYESFLAFGEESDSALASKVAKALGVTPVGGSSIEAHFAAVNRFIDASETLRIALLEMERLGCIADAGASMLPLTTSTYIQTPSKVKAAIKSKSWLAGCISGGYKKIKRAGLKPKAAAKTIIYADKFGGDEKTFPIDLCRNLINQAPNLRDKLLWSLIAATGIRVGEAGTVMLDDINTDSRTILIIPPETRKDELRKFISETEINRLTHKGRTHTNAFQIEPFSSIFWHLLEQYLKDEFQKQTKRLCISSHRFLFKNQKDGSPMLKSYQTLLEPLSVATKVVTGQKYGFHSLRHMYGYYLANFCPSPNPRPDKPFGFPLEDVQHYMGHKSIESTRRYGRTDMLMLEATLAAANMLRMENPGFSTLDQRIAYLEQRANQLRYEQQMLLKLTNQGEGK